MSEKLSATEFVELCEKLRALGVQGFKYDGCEVAFYPPEPAYGIGAHAIDTTQGRRELETNEELTEEQRRAKVRAALANEDLYASS